MIPDKINTQAPDEKTVEMVARAIATEFYDWGDISPREKDAYRATAQRVLAALRPALSTQAPAPEPKCYACNGLGFLRFDPVTGKPVECENHPHATPKGAEPPARPLITFPSNPPYDIQNRPLFWLYTHCAAIGMTERANPPDGVPTAELDIAMFTADLKARVEKAERELAARPEPPPPAPDPKGAGDRAGILEILKAGNVLANLTMKADYMDSFSTEEKAEFKAARDRWDAARVGCKPAPTEAPSKGGDKA